ncbi:MAG: Gfo/Idh/MocA family oxidoreductase [Propionibacteriaceae bacterium]|nr:Gfo/Idh/MocA family oxidoreductase [Propionibacteriaceae bacterium]
MDKIKVALVGLGAFGLKHLDAVENIEYADVTAFVVRNADTVKDLAAERGVPAVYDDLDAALASKDIDACIISSPTGIHAAQAIACMRAGKHVEVEIPICDVLSDGEAIAAVQKETGLIAMGGHTRRFNPPHQFIHSQVTKGDLSVLQMDVQTYFFRRTNINAMGQPRSWTDSLLWHHSAHTIDLFAYQTMGEIVQASAIQGPISETLGIPLDMSIQLRSSSGAICTLSLSFNNDGPIGTHFRYIGDNGTYVMHYDDMVDGHDNKVDLTGMYVSNNGIELQDREFLSAILENREPNASIQQVMPCYRTIDQLQKQLAQQN